MSSSNRLDQIVKGAAPPGTPVPTAISRSATPIEPDGAETFTTANGNTISLIQDDEKGSSTLPDPLAAAPSSPPQIYLNLLILEASLRSQYLALRGRRRQNTFFLMLLGFWLCFFGYLLFFAPREDGSGHGGSVYWVIDLGERVAFITGVIAAILFWGTGQWERSIRWPKRWLGVTNRGLRVISCKVVVVKGPWWKEMLTTFAFLWPFGRSWASGSDGWRYVERVKAERTPSSRHVDEDSSLGKEEDLAPGGDILRVLLLPKPFGPDFRENWEVYRGDYWEKENERRAKLLRKVKAEERRKAKELGGWLWWTGWRQWTRKPTPDLEKRPEKGHHRVQSKLSSLDKERRANQRLSGSHSRASSRSSTPGFEGDERPPSRGSRRGSFAEGKRRSKLGGPSISKMTSADSKVGVALPRTSRLGLSSRTYSFGSSGGDSDFPIEGTPE